MNRKKENDYGEVIKYEIGDEVRVWPIFKNPVGKVEGIQIPEHSKTVKYQVKYAYPDTGTEYSEIFESNDLTLFKKHNNAYATHCECGAETLGSKEHTPICPKYFKIG